MRCQGVSSQSLPPLTETGGNDTRDRRKVHILWITGPASPVTGRRRLRSGLATVGRRPPWGGWGSWDGPGRELVQICHKGAPSRDRPRTEARNINVSPPASQPDPGLCGRFGQLGAVAGPGRGRHGPTGDHDGHSGERTGPTGRVAGLPGRRPAPRRALRTRKCSSNRHFRVQNAPLDEEGADGDLADRGDDRPETSPATR